MLSLRNRTKSFTQVFRNWSLRLGETFSNAWRVEIFIVFIVQMFQLLQVFRNIKLWWNITVSCAVEYAIVCSRVRINQQMTKRNGCCIAMSIYERWPKCTLDVTTWCVSRVDLNSTRCAFCSSTLSSNLIWWNKLCLRHIVLKPRCLLAAAMSTNSL